MSRLPGMDAWVDIAKWLAVVIGAITFFGALVLGGLAWLLNHPD